MKCIYEKLKVIVYLLTTALLLLSSAQAVITTKENNRLSPSFSPPPFHESNVNKMISMWNTSFARDHKSQGEIFRHDPKAEEKPGFAENIKRCVGERKQSIVENFTRGKTIIMNCFKAAVILNLLKYLALSPNTSFEMFNGAVEFVKIPESVTCDGDNNVEECTGDSTLIFSDVLSNESNKHKDEYLYETIVGRVVDEASVSFRKSVNNEAEKKKLVFKEVIAYLMNMDSDKAEVELKKDLTDPKLLSVLNALTRQYLLKINFLPSAWLELKRDDGGVSLDLIAMEINRENDQSIEEGRENEGRQAEAENEEVEGRLGGNKKKKKKKFWKHKNLKHLLIPLTIQIALVPFFLKNLLFMAVKALIAGKIALLLIFFNVLRNSHAESEDYNIRVEHYGYKGEEYGAWINGRAFAGGLLPSSDASIETPFQAQKPKSLKNKSKSSD